MNKFLIIIPTVIAALVYRMFLLSIFVTTMFISINGINMQGAENEEEQAQEEEIDTQMHMPVGSIQAPVTGARAWALGCSAMLMERNGDRHDILATGDITPQVIAMQKKLLADWWDVHSRKDVFDTLEWLDSQGGHRSKFEKVGKYVCDLSDEEFNKLLSKTRDEDKIQELKIARQYYKQLGDKSIKGWDYTRYIAMCRWAYTSGYITEDEAWEKIMPAAKRVQQTFGSWEDLGENYIIGRQFWSYYHTQNSGRDFTNAFERLKTNTDSPWKKYPWDMNLDEQN